jgi:hypothetical protein
VYRSPLGRDIGHTPTMHSATKYHQEILGMLAWATSGHIRATNDRTAAGQQRSPLAQHLPSSATELGQASQVATVS